MHEGSWGAEGTNQVWMNPETSWTYTHIYPAELYIREVAPPATGATPNWARASSSSSAASSCCSNPPTGSSSSPPAPPATTPRSASSPTTTSSSNSKPSGRPSNTTAPSHRTGNPPRRNRTPRQHLPRHRPRPLVHRRQRNPPRSPHRNRSHRLSSKVTTWLGSHCVVRKLPFELELTAWLESQRGGGPAFVFAVACSPALTQNLSF